MASEDLTIGAEERTGEIAAFRRDAFARHGATRDRLSNEEEQLRLKEDHVAMDSQVRPS